MFLAGALITICCHQAIAFAHISNHLSFSLTSSSAIRLCAIPDESTNCCDKHESENSGLSVQEQIALSLGKTVDESSESYVEKVIFQNESLQKEKQFNLRIAISSFISSTLAFFAVHYSGSSSVNPIVLLHDMESSSPLLSTALTNGKPTIVDFYADWCENCKAMAPELRSIEDKYKGKVNFVLIDGDSSKNAKLVDAFRVDGIPHMALITPSGEVLTALIGNIPRKVIEEDLNALIGRKELPYAGYDAFIGSEHNVKNVF